MPIKERIMFFIQRPQDGSYDDEQIHKEVQTVPLGPVHHHIHTVQFVSIPTPLGSAAPHEQLQRHTQSQSSDQDQITKSHPMMVSHEYNPTQYPPQTAYHNMTSSPLSTRNNSIVEDCPMTPLTQLPSVFPSPQLSSNYTHFTCNEDQQHQHQPPQQLSQPLKQPPQQPQQPQQLPPLPPLRKIKLPSLSSIELSNFKKRESLQEPLPILPIKRQRLEQYPSRSYSSPNLYYNSNRPSLSSSLSRTVTFASSPSEEFKILPNQHIQPIINNQQTFPTENLTQIKPEDNSVCLAPLGQADASQNSIGINQAINPSVNDIPNPEQQQHANEIFKRTKFQIYNDINGDTNETKTATLTSNKRNKNNSKVSEFLPNIKIDEEFIARHVEREKLMDSAIELVKDDKIIKSVKITENKLIQWMVYDFLQLVQLIPKSTVVAKCSDNSTSITLTKNLLELIKSHDFNQFDISLTFNISKNGKDKKIVVDLEMVNLNDCKLTKVEIIDEFFKLFNSFNKPKTKTIKKKRKYSLVNYSKPIWSNGKNDLKVLKADINVYDL